MSIRRPSIVQQTVSAPELRLQQHLPRPDDELQRPVLRVDYLSSPGYPEGGKARERHGFVGGGPSVIVTTLGILRSEQQTQNSCSMAGFRFPVPSRSGGPVALSNFCQKMALILLNNFCWKSLNATEAAVAPRSSKTWSLERY